MQKFTQVMRPTICITKNVLVGLSCPRVNSIMGLKFGVTSRVNTRRLGKIVIEVVHSTLIFVTLQSQVQSMCAKMLLFQQPLSLRHKPQRSRSRISTLILQLVIPLTSRCAKVKTLQSCLGLQSPRAARRKSLLRLQKRHRSRTISSFQSLLMPIRTLLSLRC